MLERLGLIPYHDDYTTIWHRIHDMKPKIKLPTYEVKQAQTELVSSLVMLESTGLIS